MCKEIGRSIDMIRLSDVFRRHAVDEYHGVVRQMVAGARSFTILMSWYDHSWSWLPENNTVLKSIARVLHEMANDAKTMGAEELILPCAKGSPMAEVIEKEIFAKHKFAVALRFQEDEYGDDLTSEYGPVDLSVRTALDKGLRGFASYSQDFIYRPENDYTPE